MLDILPNFFNTISFLLKKSCVFEFVLAKEISIKELAETIAKLEEWEGRFFYNKGMPDGTVLKKLDTTKINKLGWRPKIDIKTGIKKVLKEYKNL